MANIVVKDGAAASKYLSTDGAGTDGSPYVPHHIVDSGSIHVTNTATVTANAGTNLNTSTLALESGGNLADIKTAVELIDDAISGSEMQVDVVGSLPAGSNAIGKLTANSGVDIGDVDVTSVPAPLNVTGGGVEASALRVTVANDSTGVVSVDDGGGTLTVDNAGLTELSSAINVSSQMDVNIAADGSGGVEVVQDTASDLNVTEANSGDIKTAVETIDDAISGSEMLIAGGATQSNDVKITLDGESVAISSGSVYLLANDGVDIGNVDISTVPAPLNVTGGGAESSALRVTLANDSTGVVSVDDNAGSLTVDQATHDNLNTNANLQVGDTDVANGNPVPVSDAGGTLTVDGTVAVSSGSVDVTNTVTISASQLDVDDLDKASDSVAVWSNTAKDGSGTDYQPLIDGDGHLQVDILSGGGVGGTAMTDDDAFTPATSSFTPVGGMFDDASPDSVDEGDAGIVRMSANRNLYTTIRDFAGNERGANVDASGNLNVAFDSGSVNVTNDIDINDISKGTQSNDVKVTLDSEDVTSGTADNFKADANLQVGDSDVANGNPVPVSDAGGTLTVDGTVVISSGSVDIVTLPSGNLGQQAMAASLSTVPASNITDETYIGDVKFGEGLPANDGVDIGDVTINNASGASAVNIQDGGNSITVDGAVTVSSGSVDVTNTITETNSAAIKTAVELIDDAISGSEMQVDIVGSLPAGSNNIGDVDVLSVPAPLSTTGGGTEATALRVTVANDSTGVVSIDDGGGSLTVDGTVTVSSGSVDITNTITETNSAAILADTANMDTNLGTVAGAVSGSEMQVDVVGSLPVGTNAIGKLAANSGVDIGDVTLTAGTSAVGTVDIKPVPTILRAAINSSGSGNNTIIAADGSDKHKVLGMTVIAAGDVTLTVQDGAGGSALFGPVSLAADGNGFVLPMTTQGYHWIETSAATLLNLELDAAVQVGGCITYYTQA